MMAAADKIHIMGGDHAGRAGEREIQAGLLDEFLPGDIESDGRLVEQDDFAKGFAQGCDG